MDPANRLRYFYILGAIVVFLILYGLTMPSSRSRTESFIGGADPTNNQSAQPEPPAESPVGPGDGGDNMMGVTSDATQQPEAVMSNAEAQAMSNAELTRSQPNPFSMGADGRAAANGQTSDALNIDPYMRGYGADGVMEGDRIPGGINASKGKIPKIPPPDGEYGIMNPQAESVSKAAKLGKRYPYSNVNEPNKVMMAGEFNPDDLDPNKSHLVVELPHRVNCESHADCNIVYGKGANKCVGGSCKCVKGAGSFCHMRPDYYKALCKMSPAQIIKFKKHAKLEKMTINDYLKWLSLFRYDVRTLPREHLRNFQRYMQGLPVYDIPLTDPTEEFFASQSARKDRVCLDIPNAEIDSPLNYKINSQLNNTGHMNVRGDTEKPLNWSRYYNHKALNKNRYERTNSLTMKDWFLNNINFLFTDIDRNAAYKDPNQNRYMNVLDQQTTYKGAKSDFTGQRLANQRSALSPTQENAIIPASQLSGLRSNLDPNPVFQRTGVAADASAFSEVQRA